MGWATLSATANRVAYNRLGSVSVTAGTVTGRGFLRMPSEYVHDGRVITDEYVLQAETALFGTLSYDDNITVEGVAYAVREKPLKVDDGTFCLVLLTKVAAVVNKLLFEDGFGLLLEDSSFLLLEA